MDCPKCGENIGLTFYYKYCSGGAKCTHGFMKEHLYRRCEACLFEQLGYAPCKDAN